MSESSWDLRFLDKYDIILRKKYKEAEDLTTVYPDSSLAVFRAFAELLLEQVAKRHNAPLRGNNGNHSEKQFEFINRLRDAGYISKETADLFHAIRTVGNSATHLRRLAAPENALETMKKARALAFWFEGTSNAPSTELAPEQRVGLIFHTRIKNNHHILLTRKEGLWAIPNHRIAQNTAFEDTAEAFAKKLMDSSIQRVEFVGEYTFLRPEWEYDTGQYDFQTIVVEGSNYGPVIACGSKFPTPELRGYTRALRRIVAAYHGRVKLVLTDIANIIECTDVPNLETLHAVAIYINGKCAETVLGVRSELEITTLLELHGYEKPYDRPTTGRIEVTYWLVHTEFVEADLIGSRNDTLVRWFALEQLLELPLTSDVMTPIIAAVGLLLEEAKK